MQFISSRGNEYFCEIDEDYLTDRFNLTGLNTDVQYYQYALDLVTDVFDLDCDDDMREQIEKSARHLYGLVHARYITTTRGLAKMVGLNPHPGPVIHADLYSLRNTRKAISANVLESRATLILSYPPEWQICLMSSPSSSTAANAKISTTLNHHAMPTSTAPTSAHHSRTSYSKSILL